MLAVSYIEIDIPYSNKKRCVNQLVLKINISAKPDTDIKLNNRKNAKHQMMREKEKTRNLMFFDAVEG
jgi:hypothetical protein